ncbi:DUF808 family protein [Sulfurimonas sp.]|uniref:DUF808 domain-containing protein n=1 Tax=Sulfurimonas sp. TaxID=2022749 RepID=UPI0025E1F3DD|nr:DUF808 family protein [Sulfurimonas sp.]MDD5157740.1 DUF808 family protein [Sulfurimonas sp.]
MTGGFFAILDDIAVLFDDTVAISKIAIKKTAGVLGDDLAVGAEKAAGFSASRELPVLWAITKGSFRNKLILLPLSFLLSAFTPQLIIPILILGGTYLSFEGAQKIYEYFTPNKHHKKPLAEMIMSEKDLLALEKEKIKSAILTDFILSIEVIIIALGTVASQPLTMQITIASAISVLATIGVYGIVAFLVRIDDIGIALIKISEKVGGFRKKVYKKIGNSLVISLPKIIKLLSIVGVIAMLLVGGGIFVHNIESLHNVVSFIPIIGAELFIGLIVGFTILAIEKTVSLFFQK